MAATSHFMNWVIKTGNILEEPADVLVCSAKVFLNLSGGVGGEILLRHGDAMQRELHGHLARNNLRFVQQGDVLQTAPHGLPCNAVLHAVALNGFYETSETVVRDVVEQSLSIAASLAARTVALTALATGFGRLTMRDFAAAIAPLTETDHQPIERVIICVRREADRVELTTALNIVSLPQ
jgi:O-acetyl-ADP-ribose deacetylase